MVCWIVEPSSIPLSGVRRHGRTRLRSSGSKGRLGHARTLIFITLIRGVQLFAPYHWRGLRMARPPAPGEPQHPFFRDDPDHIRQIAAAFPTAFLDGEQPKPCRFPNGILNHPATDPSPGRDLIDASGTLAMLADLVPNDPQHCQLADRELAGQRRRHRTRGGEVATTRNRDRALGCPLRPPGREDRGAAEREAHRLDLTPEDAS